MTTWNRPFSEVEKLEQKSTNLDGLDIPDSLFVSVECWALGLMLDLLLQTFTILNFYLTP